MLKIKKISGVAITRMRKSCDKVVEYTTNQAKQSVVLAIIKIIMKLKKTSSYLLSICSLCSALPQVSDSRYTESQETIHLKHCTLPLPHDDSIPISSVCRP